MVLQVRAEMVEEKGLPGPVADRIGQFVVLRGKPLELLATLSAPGALRWPVLCCALLLLPGVCPCLAPFRVSRAAPPLHLPLPVWHAGGPGSALGAEGMPRMLCLP